MDKKFSLKIIRKDIVLYEYSLEYQTEFILHISPHLTPVLSFHPSAKAVPPEKYLSKYI
jgi:hypothetical protein